ncbi:tRNA (adenosine(37)-N6)-dimethylallyltransferase MiaA [Marinilactibacillus kalidii]|uniref:tRNA (adenosine(37)-N6)-dimethylallyltransferase MiaA n=1 Tax=Marinilactibacillus kalidii TaxID=2820274 RepID=UPI001ABDE24C
MKDKLIIIVGPTAVGKTSLSIELAERIGGEIISGDAMQVYKTLDIGTAKATLSERERIPHHLIDVVEPEEPYTVSDFKTLASEKIDEIIGRGKVPIIAGGTGLYIESLLYNVSHGGEAKPDLQYRESLEKKVEMEGKQVVWETLNEVDPEAAATIHPNNVRRVIRALEVFQTTGKRFSSLQKEKQQKAPLYDAYMIGLSTDREKLYQRINQRVDLMVEQGLFDEASRLFREVSKDAQSVKGIGYKEWLPYIEGLGTFESSVESIKQQSRRYAKRQLTWFRNRMEINSWWDLVEYPTQIELLNEEIKRFLRT